jgi:hypothetical protein
MLTIGIGVFEEIAQYPVSLAAATRAAEKDLKDRAGDERGLRAWLCRPRLFRS